MWSHAGVDICTTESEPRHQLIALERSRDQGSQRNKNILSFQGTVLANQIWSFSNTSTVGITIPPTPLMLPNSPGGYWKGTKRSTNFMGLSCLPAKVLSNQPPTENIGDRKESLLKSKGLHWGWEVFACIVENYFYKLSHTFQTGHLTNEREKERVRKLLKKKESFSSQSKCLCMQNKLFWPLHLYRRKLITITDGPSYSVKPLGWQVECNDSFYFSTKPLINDSTSFSWSVHPTLQKSLMYSLQFIFLFILFNTGEYKYIKTCFPK